MWRLFEEAKLQIKKYLPVHTLKWAEAAEVVAVCSSQGGQRNEWTLHSISYMVTS